MADWKNVKVRGDLHRMVAERAMADRRSVSQMVDVLLTQALQDKPGIDLSDKIDLLQPSESFKWNGRGRETFPKPPTEGQTTVDEMLTSCPQCAGELRPFSFGELAERSVAVGAVRCVDCGWVRESSDG